MLGEFFFPSASSLTSLRCTFLPIAKNLRLGAIPWGVFNHGLRRCCLVALGFLLNFRYRCFLAAASTRYPVKFPHRLPRC